MILTRVLRNSAALIVAVRSIRSGTADRAMLSISSGSADKNSTDKSALILIALNTVFRFYFQFTLSESSCCFFKLLFLLSSFVIIIIIAAPDPLSSSIHSWKTKGGVSSLYK